MCHTNGIQLPLLLANGVGIQAGSKGRRGFIVIVRQRTGRTHPLEGDTRGVYQELSRGSCTVLSATHPEPDSSCYQDKDKETANCAAGNCDSFDFPVRECVLRQDGLGGGRGGVSGGG